MIRNLKVLFSAALTLAAVGALSASPAQAHTPAEFHCHVAPCAATLEPDLDETVPIDTTTAHHVLVAKNAKTKPCRSQPTN